jgi:hypothetical protein
MSSIVICPRCGGILNATPGEPGVRACSCERGAVATAYGTSVQGAKICCVCGADVSGKRRMKDGTGRYWCYECGAADQLKRGTGMVMTCPRCQKQYPPIQMVKEGEDYLCRACHTDPKAHASGKPNPVQVILVFVVVALIMGLLLYLLTSM